MNTNYTKNTFKTLNAFFAFAVITLFSACGGSDTETPNYGSLSVYNASPTLATYDVYLNGTKLNSAALPYAGGVKYSQLVQGTYEVKYTVATETAAIYTKSGIAVGDNSVATLYLIGTSGNFDGLLVSDVTSNTSTEKSYVRFINLSPDAPALDLGIKDATSDLATEKVYKAYSNFIAVDPGAKTFEIKDNSSGTVKTTIDRTLVAGSFYTIIAGGKVTPATDLEKPFNGQIILHQ